MNHYFFPPPLPHLGARGTTETSRAIRSAYVRLAWSSRDPSRLIGYGLACATWPAVLVCAALYNTARSGRRVGRSSGKSLSQQFLEQLQLGIVHTIRPRTYYIFELHDPARFAVAGSYLQRFETKGGLYSALKSRKVPAGRRKCLSDKLRFFERCRALKMATPRVLMALDKGRALALEGDGGDLPPIDLFVKPTHGGGGKGAELWQYADECWVRAGERLDSEAFLERALERSKCHPLIIQEALRPHAAIAGLSVGALPTARIITIVDESGEIEVGGAVFRMSIRWNSAIDNVHAGAIAATIDPRSGRLGQATDIGLGPISGRHDCHHITGAPITGTQLPHWPAAVEL
ncbi:MAG TPA: sugar-transfer associated ATP-grasp domain-containing protein, partial [Dongiaceae bacterium]